MSFICFILGSISLLSNSSVIELGENHGLLQPWSGTYACQF
jgi:hypothetical protein